MNSTTTLPQEVTIRYIGNLIRHGENDAFELINLIRQDATHDDVVIGHYYGRRRNPLPGRPACPQQIRSHLPMSRDFIFGLIVGIILFFLLWQLPL